MKGNRRWLQDSVRIRSPKLAGDRWHLPRNCLVRLVIAAVDRYGYVAVYRDMSKLTRCTNACLEATASVGDAVVADRGETTRTLVVYGAKQMTLPPSSTTAS